MSALEVTHYSDPGCPWAWSASPALAVLQWRYQDQLAWRHVMIGLTESEAIMEAATPDEVARAFEADRDETRSAAGSPTEFQGKSANYDGRVRYTAPSVKFTAGDRTLEAGGFQPVEAYDVLIANLDP